MCQFSIQSALSDHLKPKKTDPVHEKSSQQKITVIFVAALSRQAG
jgi:hypothetical protein